MQALWLYLSFPALQLDLLFQQQAAGQTPSASVQAAPAASASKAPEEASLPLVLIHPQQLRVHQLCPLAYAAGIRAGQPLAQACALSAQLQVLPWSAAQERSQLQQLADEAYQLCADVALSPTDCALWLRLDPMLQLYGGLSAITTRICNWLAKRRIRYQSGRGSTPEAARLLCLHAHQPAPASAEAEQAALDLCPLHLLDIDGHTLHQLQRLGLQQLGQLRKLPAADLNQRFGQALLTCLAQLTDPATGTGFCGYQPAEQFSQLLELRFQAEQSQYLVRPLEVLLKRLQHHLYQRNQRCYRLELRLSLRDQPPQVLTLQSPQAEAQACRWLALWQLRLETLQLPAPVLAMQLSAQDYCEQAADQQDLYAGKQGRYTTEQLLGLLQARLGAESLQRPVLVQSHLPEYAGQQQSAAFATSLTRHPPLQAVKEQALAADSSRFFAPDARPAFVYHIPQPLREAVRCQSTLERLQSHWWQADLPARDYRIGQNSKGQWLWIYRDEQQRWFIHGVFA